MPGCSSQFTPYQPSHSQCFSQEFQRPVARNEQLESQAPETSFDVAISLAQRCIDSSIRESNEEIHDDIEDEQIIEAIDNGLLNDVDQEDGAGTSSSPPHVMEPISAFFTDTSGFGTSDGWMQPSVRISVYDPIKNNLQKGQLFKSKELLQHAVRKYSVDEKKEIKVSTTNSHRWEVFCKLRDSTGCSWRLSGSLKPKLNNMWEIVRYDGAHTCVRTIITENHSQLTSKFICREIYPFVKADPSYKISQIVTLVEERFKCVIGYYKAWNAKQKAIAQIFGSWENSYKELPKFLLAIKKYNPGTVIEFDTKPKAGDPHSVTFDRVFWAFKPSIDGFKYCRPVVSIDATHLYGKYQGKLLIAMGKDANGQIFPLAFAIVDQESARSWGWFLQLLRNHVVKARKGLCLISDRHAGIKAAVKDERYGWGRTYDVHHRFCLRHVQSNFSSSHKGPELKELCWKAGTQAQPHKFDAVMAKIKEIDPKAFDYLNKIPAHEWTLAHDGGRRFGDTTTNLSECFNGVLKFARFLPVTACVQVIFFRLVRYHQERRQKAAEWISNKQLFTPNTNEMLELRQQRCVVHHVTKYNNTTFEAAVFTPGGFTVKVVLDQHTCDCRKWEVNQFPCSHAIAVCRKYKFDAADIISVWFTSKACYEAWLPDFHPVLHEIHWDEWTGPTWLPDIALLRKKGRPKASRINNEMDIPEPTYSTNHCRLCREPGHNQRMCPHRVDRGAAHRMRP